MVILVIYKLCLFKKKNQICKKKMARWREKEGRWETVGCIIVTSSISLSAIYYSLASLSTSLILHSQQKIGQCGKRLSFRNCDCRLAIRFSFLQLKDKTSYYRCLSQNTSVLIFVAMSFTFRQILHFKKLWMTKLQQFESHCNYHCSRAYIEGFNTNFFPPYLFIFFLLAARVFCIISLKKIYFCPVLLLLTSNIKIIFIKWKKAEIK